jgi:hypothetical protein
MAETKYTYSISADFPSGLSSSRLKNEIAESAITIALERIDTVGDSADIVFKNSLPAGDKTILDSDETGPCGGLIGNHSGEPLPNPTDEEGIPYVREKSWKTQGTGAQLVAAEPRQGSETIQATHVLTDPTTWFEESERVTDEVASSSDGGTTWDLDNQNVIDLMHGKVMNEDNVVAAQGSHGYGVAVTVDDVEKTMRPPFATDWSQGGDYYVNYAAGQVVFQSPQTGTVEVSYSYENGSGWKLAPIEGKMIRIEQAEAQFSSDAEYNDTVRFYVVGYVIVCAPEQAQSNGGPLPDYDKIIIDETKYKLMDNLIDEAIGAFPEIPIIGGPRGVTNKRYGFPFKYSTTRDLYYTYGMELWVKLENDVAFGGERATATFYCTVADEDI